MIARRENFQRVYDLAERVLAKMRATRLPQYRRRTMRRAFVLGAVRALGVTQARWIADYFRSGRRLKDADLDAYRRERRTAARSGRRLERAGLRARRSSRHVAIAAARGRLRATHTTLLSPFDPVVWDRERASSCSTSTIGSSATRRRRSGVYGYFVLPILHRGRLVGRLDAKAHRADGGSRSRRCISKTASKPPKRSSNASRRAIKRCAEWHATPDVEIGPCTPRAFRSPLRQALRKLETDATPAERARLRNRPCRTGRAAQRSRRSQSR